MGTNVGNINLGLNINQRQFNQQLQGLASGAEKQVTSAFSGLGRKIGTVLGGIAVGAFVKDCLELGSNLSEVQNVVDTTFTTMADKVNEFAKSAMTDFGMSETMAKKYVGTLGTMSKSMGFTEQSAYDMATSVTKLGGDVASFYNLSQEEAMTKLKSIWTGETEAIKDLGVVMTQTALDQYALNNGFGKVTAKMTEQEKVMLRYQYVMSALSGAQGDFARTSDSWANQTRILSLQFESLKAALGQGFIALFTPIIQVINGLLGKLVSLANGFKSFIETITGSKVEDSTSGLSGIANDATTAASGMDGLSSSTANVGKAAEKTKKALKGLTGIDEINNLSDTSSDSSPRTGTASGGGVATTPMTVDVDTSKAESKISDLTKTTKELFDGLKKNFLAGFFDGLGTNFGSNVSKIKESAKGIITTLADIFTDSKVLSSASNFANTIVKNLGSSLGSVISIGTTIAANILGGLNKSLAENKDRIKKYIIDFFNIQSEISNIKARFLKACADIFSVFSGESAISITSDIISMFTTAFTSISTLSMKFGRDVLDAITKPVVENKDKIKKALENTLSGLSTIINGLKKSVASIFDNLNKVYDTKVKPAIDAIGTGFSNLFGTILDCYNTYFAPVIKNIASKVSELFTKYIAPFVNNVVDFVGTLASSIATIWQKTLVPLLQKIVTFVSKYLANPIEKAINGVINVVKGIIKTFDGIITSLKGVIEFLTGVFTLDFEKIWNGLKMFLEGIWTSIKGIFSTVGSFFKGIFSTAVSLIKSAFSSINSFFSGIWSGIKGVFSKVGSWFKSIFSAAVTGINNTFSGVKNFFSGIWNGIKSVFSSVGNWFKNIFSTAVTGIKNAFSSVKSFFSGIWNGIKNVFSKVGSWFKSIFSSAVSGIKTAFSGVKSFFSSIWKGIKGVFGTVGSWFKGIFDGAVKKIKGAFNGISGFFGGIWKGIKGAFGNVTGWFKDVFSKAWQGVKNVFSTGGKIFDGIKDGIANVFKSVVNAIIGGINKIIAFPFNKINGLLNKIRSVSIFSFKPFESLWSENPLPVPQIPKLAKGAIIDTPTLAMVGEAGKEAVMPLENNTGWIDQLADRIASRIPQTTVSNGGDTTLTIELSIGGKKFGKVCSESINNLKKRSGRLPVHI